MDDTSNPFVYWPASEIVPAADLVGREPVVAELLERLPGRSVIMAGPRRTGKTSVAREVLRRLDEDGFITASLDFLRVTGKRDCAEMLTKQLLEHSHSFRGRLQRLGGAVKTAAGRLEPHVKLAEMEFGMSLTTERDENKLLRQALELPEKLAMRLDRRVVILMDEFQEADRSLGSDIFGLMRSFFQEQRRTHQLFAGSRATLLRKLFSAPKSALFRHAIEVELPAAPQQVWVEYIVRKFELAGISCSSYLAEKIVQTTAGHPADTMEVCQQLHEVLNVARSEVVLPDHVPIAMDRAERLLKGVFDEMWMDLGDTSYARRVAQRIAEGLPPRSRPLHPEQSGAALRALTDKGVVTRDGKRYVFGEPMFERYVRRLREGP